MSATFEYSILKYRPSYLLDERVNIGLLFRFQNTTYGTTEILKGDKFVFVNPSRLVRISSAFPNLGNQNLPNIKQYLHAFKKTATKISFDTDNIHGTKQQSFRDIIQSHFLIDDANSFFFSEVKEGIYSSLDDIVNYYQGQYFKYYDNSPIKHNPDTKVKDLFNTSLLELTNPSDHRLKYFKKGVQIENKIATSQFEFCWQNGTTNLVKTLGFDLSDKQGIQNKAFRWNAAINYVHQEDEYRDHHFDILIGEPTNKSLFETYENAIEVLQDIRANKNIIVGEKDIKQYAEKALDTVKPSKS